MTRRLFLTLVGLFASSCNKIYTNGPTTVTDDNGNPDPTPVADDTVKIEYRVQGNALSARIRYSNDIDGLSQVVTTLPYDATITGNGDSMFLSLEATPTGYAFEVIYPFLAVQIFVNGKLFK